MHAFLTVRKLKSGSYDDWRRAWEPDEWPEDSKKAYILRNVDDPDEIIAFGFFDTDPRRCVTTPTFARSSGRASSGWRRTSSRLERTGSTR